MKLILKGFRAMLPITTGVIPFGAVMGSVAHDAGMGFPQSIGMNFIVYAGAAQLASVDLMVKGAASVVVIVTGLMINLRFLLYSAAMSPVLQNSRLLTKVFCAYSLTDQGYAVMTAYESKLKTNSETIQFYLGCSICMILTWHLSVIAGMVFGNFAPKSWALDFAVPLSFVALVMPTIKNLKYVVVVLFSAIMSLLLNPLPYRVGLVLTALLAIGLGVCFSVKKKNV